MSRRGFTLVELLTTMAVIGLLASIALPKYQQLTKRANATDVVAALTTARAAAYSYVEGAGVWPATSPLGKVPAGLAQYLPGGGSGLFNAKLYQLGWQVTATVSANRKAAGSTQQIYAYSTDPVICQSVYGLMGGAKNVDLISLCGKAGGYVYLYVDR